MYVNLKRGERRGNYHESSKDGSSAHTGGPNNEKLDFRHLSSYVCVNIVIIKKGWVYK